MENCRAVIVEESIHAGIKKNLEELLSLWLTEGVERIFVILHPSGAGNSPVPMRDYLKSLDTKYHLQGVMFIGELPVAFFEKAIDRGPGISPSIVPYTSDYFFMELDGFWTLGEANKVTTQLRNPPKICAGRVFIGTDTGIAANRPPVTDLYNRYLKKAIEFRIKGEAYRQNRKAVVVSNLGGIIAYRDHLAHLYSPPQTIDTVDGATETQYKQVIETDHDWILYYGHSNPGQHQMAGGGSWNPYDYLQANIRVNVFQFEACGVGGIAWQTRSDPYDPTSPLVAKAMSDTFVSNILGNLDRGVLVLAPSIGGFFNEMDRFYGHLRSGYTIGEAFRQWMMVEISQGEPHYMNLFGDPFLSFQGVNPSLYKKPTWFERLMNRLMGRIRYVQLS